MDIPNTAKIRLNVPVGVDVHCDSLDATVSTMVDAAAVAAAATEVVAVTPPLLPPPPRGMESRWRRVAVDVPAS